jgi:hypothetical protein
LDARDKYGLDLRRSDLRSTPGAWKSIGVSQSERLRVTKRVGLPIAQPHWFTKRVGLSNAKPVCVPIGIGVAVGVGVAVGIAEFKPVSLGQSKREPITNAKSIRLGLAVVVSESVDVAQWIIITQSVSQWECLP